MTRKKENTNKELVWPKLKLPPWDNKNIFEFGQKLRCQTNGGAIATACVLRINSRVCLVAMEKCWRLLTQRLLGWDIFWPTGPVGNPIRILHQDVHVPFLVQDLLFWLKKNTHTRVSMLAHNRKKTLTKIQTKKNSTKDRLMKYIGWAWGLNAGCVNTDELCAGSCHGDRPTYLAVSSAGHVHVEDELSVILGAVGPWWAAGGDTWKSDVSQPPTCWQTAASETSRWHRKSPDR